MSRRRWWALSARTLPGRNRQPYRSRHGFVALDRDRTARGRGVPGRFNSVAGESR